MGNIGGTLVETNEGTPDASVQGYSHCLHHIQFNNTGCVCTCIYIYINVYVIAHLAGTTCFNVHMTLPRPLLHHPSAPH